MVIIILRSLCLLPNYSEYCMCYSVGGMTEANIKFTTNENPKQSDIPAAMTLLVDRYFDVHVTGSELIGVESDEPLRVLRMTGTSDGDDDDDDDDDDDCAIEFEVVEPFQPQSMIQAFTSALGSRDASQNTVWLLVDVNLLKSDKLSVDEINVLDSQVNGGESVEVRGANFSAVRMTLTPGFHIVAAVNSGSGVTPQLDLFQYIYVPESGHGNPPPCVAEVICGRRDGVGSSPREFPTAGVENTALRSLIDSYPVNDAALSASQQQDRRSTSGGDESVAGISPIPARIGADGHARINRRTTTQTSGNQREPDSSQVTDTVHPRVGDDVDKTRNQSSVYNVSATAPESVNVPYVVHPMVSGDRPAESYVVKIGNAADDLAASGPQGSDSGPQGPPVWRTGSHDELSSEPVSPTVIAVLTSLGVAIFFVIVCILGFVVSELVCGESGYGRARLLGKHGARVSPYYVD